MNLTDVWIVVGKRVTTARGHLRGDVVMVPSPHGPLYFRRPQWHETKSAAEKHAKRKSK